MNSLQAVTPTYMALPYRGTVGMACLIAAESAIFTLFVVAYLFYVGTSVTRPSPREVPESPLFCTICILSSSLTIHLATRLLRRGRQIGFHAFWFTTIV